MMTRVLVIFLGVFFMLLAVASGVTGCASKEKQGTEISTRLDADAYAKLIAKYTRHESKYDGFYNKYDLYVTFMNSDVLAAILQNKSDMYQWDARQAQTEREKMFQENSTQTKFMLSFFIPSTRLNDLHKGASIWKTYLEVGGQRYEGKVSRKNGKLEDIQSLLPHHTRWGVPYEVVFNVPLSGAEKSAVKFILTSSQGTSVLEF